MWTFVYTWYDISIYLRETSASRMKGFVPVEIPTKKYIKAYIVAQFGDRPLMNTDHNIGSMLYNILQRGTNDRRTQFSTKRYDANIKMYISRYTYETRGAHLNETNIKSFNVYIEREIKKTFRIYMDFFILIHPNFEANLPEVRRLVGIDVEAWNDDSIRKDYYRYRKRAGLPPLYKKSLR